MLLNFPIKKRFDQKPKSFGELIKDLTRSFRIDNKIMQVAILEELSGKNGYFIEEMIVRIKSNLITNENFLDEVENLPETFSNSTANEILYKLTRIFSIDLIVATNIYLKIRKNIN